MFDKLNLPPFDIRLSRGADDVVRVYDPQRRKWLVATPEEWVRQHFVNYLIGVRDFPASLVANEVGLTFNNMKRRCDTLIYTKNLQPLCVVEYKRPTVAITKAVFDQIARYNSVIGARYLIVSNGLRHYCCQFCGDGYKFLSEIPDYNLMINGDFGK